MRPSAKAAVTIPAWFFRMWANSVKDLAGTRARTGSATGMGSLALCADRRKPSAEARVISSSARVTSTPVSTGRALSLEAEKAVWRIISNRHFESIWMPSPSKAGSGGNSSAWMHFIWVFDVPQLSFIVAWASSYSSDMASGGSVPTRSKKVRAGRVVAPSRSIRAPIQQVTLNSRSVAASRRRPFSVATRIFPSTGKVVRGDVARETIFNPCLRFSCKTVIFMTYSFL